MAKPFLNRLLYPLLEYIYIHCLVAEPFYVSFIGFSHAATAETNSVIMIIENPVEIFGKELTYLGRYSNKLESSIEEKTIPAIV